MKDKLAEFVHNAVFLRQVKTQDEIFWQAKKKGFSTNRAEIHSIVEAVATPYKAKR